MKIYRPIERAAHWLALFVSAAAMIGVTVLISRPSEKSGNQPSFVGAEQQKKRLAILDQSGPIAAAMRMSASDDPKPKSWQRRRRPSCLVKASDSFEVFCVRSVLIRSCLGIHPGWTNGSDRFCDIIRS